jgi:hypothetical protein
MKKRIMTVAMAALLVIALAVPTFAATPDIDTILGTALTETADKLVGSIGTVLPIALPVMGIGIAIGFTVKLFRKLTAKAQ